jgi:hypothetical protein
MGSVKPLAGSRSCHRMDSFRACRERERRCSSAVLAGFRLRIDDDIGSGCFHGAARGLFARYIARDPKGLDGSAKIRFRVDWRSKSAHGAGQDDPALHGKVICGVDLLRMITRRLGGDLDLSGLNRSPLAWRALADSSQWLVIVQSQAPKGGCRKIFVLSCVAAWTSKRPPPVNAPARMDAPPPRAGAMSRRRHVLIYWSGSIAMPVPAASRIAGPL